MSATTGGIVEVGTQDILKVHFRDRRLLELGGGGDEFIRHTLR